MMVRRAGIAESVTGGHAVIAGPVRGVSRVARASTRAPGMNHVEGPKRTCSEIMPTYS